MERFNVHPNLAGKNILIVEFTSGLVYKEYKHFCEKLEKMKVVGIDVMPSCWGQTLLEYMEEKGTGLGIIHDSFSVKDIEQIIEAKEKGKRIVVAKREQNNPHMVKDYEKLEQNGIVCLSKLEPSYIRFFVKALDLLAKDIK